MALFPHRSAPYVFAFLLSGFMTIIVSGIATLVGVGITAEFLTLWVRSWITAWVIAFPALLVVRPFVHRMANWLTGHAPTPR
ncbi:MAG: DUF2798 domain-containing protein [Betaproteobacteria bacterium]